MDVVLQTMYAFPYVIMIAILSIILSGIIIRFTKHDGPEDKVDEFMAFSLLTMVTFLLWWILIPLISFVLLLYHGYDIVFRKGGDRIVSWWNNRNDSKQEELDNLKRIIKDLEAELKESMNES